MDYGQPSYGYSAQHARSIGGSGVGVGIRSVNPSQAQVGIPSHHYHGSPAGATINMGATQNGGNMNTPQSASVRADRSAQINEYVAKQKAAKLNAPLIKKVTTTHTHITLTVTPFGRDKATALSHTRMCS